jgi:hypothetical protein
VFIFVAVQAKGDIVAVAGVAVGLVKCLDRPAADFAVGVVKNPLWRWQLVVLLHPLMMLMIVQPWVVAVVPLGFSLGICYAFFDKEKDHLAFIFAMVFPMRCRWLIRFAILRTCFSL